MQVADVVPHARLQEPLAAGSGSLHASQAGDSKAEVVTAVAPSAPPLVPSGASDVWSSSSKVQSLAAGLHAAMDKLWQGGRENQACSCCEKNDLLSAARELLCLRRAAGQR